ncbi:uncharacterized protein DFL_009039 [Arthrobotrys flagrans]|uniref:Uncharacterized protein n=1 Tax=Arthrobotrys flagrans TaxID=97331 RepID=A0A436ZQJ8_ARTFL|nr:hypothetical protein DFL_009039 [Arthrobotrys flagrans]
MTSRHHPPPSSPSPPPPPTAFTSSSQTNNNRQHIRDQTVFSQPDPTKKPFTPSSYRSRFSNPTSNSNPNNTNTSIPPGHPTPKKRRSIFIEQLDSSTDQIPPNNAPIISSSSPKNPRRITPQTILSINPLSQKDSYMMHLPLQPLRISILLFLLVTFTTISLSTSAESDLDSLLLKRVPGEDQGVVERREGNYSHILLPLIMASSEGKKQDVLKGT